MAIHINSIIERLKKVKDMVADIETTMLTEVIYGDISRPTGVKMKRRLKPGPKPGFKRVKREEVKPPVKAPPVKTPAPIAKKSPPVKKAPVKKAAPTSPAKKTETKKPEMKTTVRPSFKSEPEQSSLPGVKQ